MFSVVLTGGMLHDGTGSPGYRADVGIAGDRIKAVGHLRSVPAQRTIDVGNRVISPGFIDVHAHSEFSLLRGDGLEARVRQGVTTDLLAPDGFAYAPLSGERLDEMKSYLSVFNGPPDESWHWSDVSEYQNLFKGRVGINVVPQVGFNAIRAEAVGWEARPANPDEIREMRALTHHAMEQGATGMQTGLDYYPSGNATTKELVAVASVVAEYGGVYSSHVRSNRLGLDAGVEEALAVGRDAQVPVHLSHLFGTAELYGQLEKARSQGIDVTFDAYPYMAGCTHLSFCLPESLQLGPPDNVIESLRDKATPSRIESHIASWFEQVGTKPEEVRFASVPPGPHQHLEGHYLADAVVELGGTLAETVCDLLVENRLNVLMVFHWHDDAKLQRALIHPLGMLGSDGLFRGRSPHPRGFGAHARMLAFVVREKGWLSLPDAIRRMTSLPAARYGLTDRGIVRPGLAADLAVFDPETVQDMATFENGRTPAVGFDYVFVNGRVVLDAGALTDTTAGRVLKRHETWPE